MDRLINALIKHGHEGKYIEVIDLFRVNTGFIKLPPDACKNMAYITICADSLVIYDTTGVPEVYPIKQLIDFGIREYPRPNYRALLLSNGQFIDFDKCRYINKGKYYTYRYDEINCQLNNFKPDQDYKLYEHIYSEYKTKMYTSILINYHRPVLLVKGAFLLANNSKFRFPFIFTELPDENAAGLRYYMLAEGADEQFYLINSDQKIRMYKAADYDVKPNAEGLYNGLEMCTKPAIKLQHICIVGEDYIGCKANGEIVELDLRKPDAGSYTKPAHRARADELEEYE